MPRKERFVTILDFFVFLFRKRNYRQKKSLTIFGFNQQQAMLETDKQMLGRPLGLTVSGAMAPATPVEQPEQASRTDAVRQSCQGEVTYKAQEGADEVATTTAAAAALQPAA